MAETTDAERCFPSTKPTVDNDPGVQRSEPEATKVKARRSHVPDRATKAQADQNQEGSLLESENLNQLSTRIRNSSKERPNLH